MLLKGRRKKEEGRRKKEEEKILRFLSFNLSFHCDKSYKLHSSYSHSATLKFAYSIQ
ncbi:MAG: hypothetical protein F6K24_32940 [Okeania sp. SIO2D1]|nr:hypothetical protein [Okeania sp. SIO2D1]